MSPSLSRFSLFRPAPSNINLGLYDNMMCVVKLRIMGIRTQEPSHLFGPTPAQERRSFTHCLRPLSFTFNQAPENIKTTTATDTHSPIMKFAPVFLGFAALAAATQPSAPSDAVARAVEDTKSNTYAENEAASLERRKKSRFKAGHSTTKQSHNSSAAADRTSLGLGVLVGMVGVGVGAGATLF